MGLFGSNDITGVDIGSGSIKVVRIKRGRRPKLLSAALVEISPDPALTTSIGAELRALRSGKKIGLKNIITLMPGRDLTIRSLTLPKMPLNELSEAVRWEAKRHVSFPVESAQVEFVVTNEKREGLVEKYDIVMVAAERQNIRGHLSPFEEANLVVSAVDANALALRNTLRLSEASGDENILIVDIGAGKTEINIFKKSVLLFSRCVESGGLEMTRAVSEALGTGLTEAEEIKRGMNMLTPNGNDPAHAAVRVRLDTLLMEIRRSVAYYKTTFREKDVQKMILTGGVALMKGIGEYCAKSLEHAVVIDQPFQGLLCKDALLEEFGPLAPRFSAAIGLGLRKT